MNNHESSLSSKFAAIRLFLDEHLREGGLGEQSYLAAMVLLTAAEVGPDAAAIAADLDVDKAFVQTIEQRMRFSGLWSGGFVFTEHWFDHGCFPGFYEDLAVAEGMTVCFRIGEETHYLPARHISFRVI